MSMKMKMKERVNKDTQYDERYKFYLALTEDAEFKKKIADYKMRLSIFGLAIPVGGFKNEEEANRWIHDVGRKRFEMMTKDKNYLREEYKITKGKENLPLQESLAVDDLQERLLPPELYFSPLLQIMESFIKVRKYDSSDYYFITNFVLFEKIIYYPRILNMRVVRGKDFEPLELWIRIYPNTRKKDVIEKWRDIKKLQEALPGYEKRLRNINTLDDIADTATPGAIRTAKYRIKKRIRNDVTDKESP